MLGDTGSHSDKLRAVRQGKEMTALAKCQGAIWVVGRVNKDRVTSRFIK